MHDTGPHRVVDHSAPTGGGSIWTNRAEAHSQLVLSPMRAPRAATELSLGGNKSSRRDLSIPGGPEA